jgi:hypothetical protein
MKRFLFGGFCLWLLFPLLNAQEKNVPTGLPPLIDREVIFGNPEIAAAQMSPNGGHVAFLKPWKGTRNVYVKAVLLPLSRLTSCNRKDTGTARGQKTSLILTIL